MMKHGLVVLGWLMVSACEQAPEPKLPVAPPLPLPSSPSATARSVALAPPTSAATTSAPPKVPAKTKSDFPPPRKSGVRLSLTDATPDANLLAGDDAFDREDYKAAEAAYVRALKSKETRLRGRVGVARCKLARLGFSAEYASAKGDKRPIPQVGELRAVLAEDGAIGVAHFELGKMLLLLADPEPAVAALEKALALLPEEAEVQSTLGLAYLATGKTAKAAEALGKARDLDPGNASRQGNFGTAQMMIGKPEGALEPYRNQVILADTDPKAHSDLAVALLSTGDLEGGILSLKKAIELDPKRATFRSNLGYALQQKGDAAGALASYMEATKLDPKLGSAWINLATLLSKDPKTRAKAREALETARKLDPSDPRVQANLDELSELEKKSP
jgi:Flp pilus assembly protein TadD